MIKRIRFVTRRNALPDWEFPAAWATAVALVGEAPVGARPTRTVACTTLHDVSTKVAHDGISMEWFADMAALQRFQVWLGSENGQRAACAAGAVEPAATVVIVAEEVVMRGADWLARRWAEGAMKLKHMALARRAAGLTPAAFAERWRSRPGTIGGAGSAPAMAIPDEAKGYAYVQNHPLPNSTAEWRYDAVNEVYFEDLAAMRSRIALFEKNDVGRAEADLVSDAAFVAVTERVVDSAPR
jgi:hypothetical protein